MNYIDTQEALDQVIRAVEASSWAALDSEADSLHHYAEKLCLLQISVPKHDFIIDPLAPVSLESLARVLNSKKLIFHGADFDIRIIRKPNPVFSPKEIFDTLLAGQLLGYDKLGLSDLAERHCGVRLSKASQKADWSRRPLGEELLRYAANDTHHLKSISSIMAEELVALGRLEWHEQACRRVLAAALTEREARPLDEAWQIKGARALAGKELTYLKELWHWRDSEARRMDRPPFKVLNSEILLALARWAAAHPGADVGEMPKVPRHLRGEYREAMNRILMKASTLSATFLKKKSVHSLKRYKWREEDNQELARLKEERQRISGELKIHPSVLATNAALEAIVMAKPKDRHALAKLDCLLPWQADILTGVTIQS